MCKVEDGFWGELGNTSKGCQAQLGRMKTIGLATGKKGTARRYRDCCSTVYAVQKLGQRRLSRGGFWSNLRGVGYILGYSEDKPNKEERVIGFKGNGYSNGAVWVLSRELQMYISEEKKSATGLNKV